MAATNVNNNGLPRSSYSITGDGARAGQTFNDELFAGISSVDFGTLTGGRQRALGTDAMLAYDPADAAREYGNDQKQADHNCRDHRPVPPQRDGK